MHELGGKLEENDDHKMTIKAGPLKPEDYLSRYGSEAAVANRPDIKEPGVGMKTIPLYDEGGYVDVNDGKHQVAVLQDGERVLTPDEAEQYRAEHPEAAKPTEETTKQPTEVATNTPTPKLSRLGGSVESPKPTEEAQEKPVEEKPKLTYGHILADNWLKSNGMPSVVDMLKAPKEFNQGTPDQSTAPQGEAPAAPQGGLKPIALPDTASPAAPAPTGKEAFHQKIAAYDKEYQDAMDKAAQTNDPQYSLQAARIKEAKLAYENQHPWGAKESAHPGVLGKIGHVAEMVAQRTPFGIAPIVSTIPGSEGYRAAEAQGLQGTTTADQRAATEQQNANTAETSAKNAGTNGQQYAQSLRDLAAAEATHDPAKIAVAQRAADDAKKALDESKPVAKIPTGDEPLGSELVTQYNRELADRYQVLNPGKQLPQEFMLPPTATANDYNRRHTAMEGVEKATGVQSQLNTANQQKTEAAAVHKEEHAGKLYDDYNKQVDKVSAPMEAISSRATLLLHNLDAKDKQADAQVAPELLSIASGGVGSGLRMNEAEISRVVGGRSVWDSLIAMANKVREGEGTFSDEQRLQMHKIGEYIYDRAAAVTTVYSDAKDRMLSDKSNEDAVRKDYNDAKRIANQIVRQGIVPAGTRPKDGEFIFHDGRVLIVKGGKVYPAIP